MNISSEIFPNDVSNSSVHLYNGTEIGFPLMSVINIVIVLFGFPINSYVIWLIVTGTGNGLAAELFSLNHSICEMLFCLECLFSLISCKVENLRVFLYFLDGLTTSCRPLFQTLICVERYLAVVHPVTFLKFKPLRYRLICCAFIWAASFVYGRIMFTSLFIYLSFSCYILILVYLFLFFLIQLFCLVAVLRALKQSGPGDRNKNHMKRRAFYLILITTISMGCLFLLPFAVVLTFSDLICRACVVSVCLALAGSVQPLLFLYRVEKPIFVRCQ